MLKIGRLCVKLSGREAGNKCVVVDVIDKNFVLIDGNVRRRRCSITHLEPLDDAIELEKGASRDKVVSAFKKLKILKVKVKVKRKPKATKSKVSEKTKDEKK